MPKPSPEKNGSVPAIRPANALDFIVNYRRIHKQKEFMGSTENLFMLLWDKANENRWESLLVPAERDKLTSTLRIGRRALELCIEQLEAHGLVKFTAGKGRGKSSVFELITPSKKDKTVPASTVNESEKRIQPAPLFMVKTDSASTVIPDGKGIQPAPLFEVKRYQPAPLNAPKRDSASTVLPPITVPASTVLPKTPITVPASTVLPPITVPTGTVISPKTVSASTVFKMGGWNVEVLKRSSLRYPLTPFYSLKQATTAASSGPKIEDILVVRTNVLTTGVNARGAAKNPGAGEKEKKLREKKKREEPAIWGAFKESYMGWIAHHTGGMLPDMDGTQVWAGYDIIESLRKSVVHAAMQQGQDLIPMLQDDQILAQWNLLLENSHLWDEYHQNRTKLSEIKSHLQNINKKIHHELFRKTSIDHPGTDGTSSSRGTGHTGRAAASGGKGRGKPSGLQGLKFR